MNILYHTNQGRLTYVSLSVQTLIGDGEAPARRSYEVIETCHVEWHDDPSIPRNQHSFPVRQIKTSRGVMCGLWAHSFVRLERFSLAKFAQCGFYKTKLLFPNKKRWWSALLV
jgi:hypothetical protein